MKEYRVGCIILNGDKLLLVRYKSKDNKTFLVGPGGEVELFVKI